MGTCVIDRPLEALDDWGLPPLPPDVDDGGGEPLPPRGPEGPRVWRLIAWNVALVASLPAMDVIVRIIGHAG